MKEDFELLQVCLNRIVQELNWPDPQLWANHYYEDLSNHVMEATGVNVSSTTFKRLYGKVQTANQEYIPRIGTLNALVQFIGYDNWVQFKDAQNPKDELDENKKKKSDKKLYYIISIVFISIIEGTLFFIYSNKKHNPEYIYSNTNFEVEESFADKAPFTAVFHYDISKIKDIVLFNNDDYAFQQKDEQTLVLDKHDSVITHIYKYGGLFRPRIYQPDLHIRGKEIHILTDSWNALCLSEGNPIVQVFKHEMPDGQLFISPEQIEKHHIDSLSEFRSVYILSQKFNNSVDDDFNLQFEFLPKYPKSKLSCNHFQIKLTGESDFIRMMLEKKGCEGNAELRISDSMIQEGNDLLESLIFDAENWNTFSLKINKQNASVIINNNNKIALEYSKSIGLLKVIRMEFLGAGKVKNIQLNGEEI